MAIALYEHNQIAYDAAVRMLAETGKATIIHPTGTGKSFIGFKLCEDNPGKTICWLSPSEYIFRTQLENLRAAADGWQPENIQFYTYAKLMLMAEAEIAAIRPDYIVLDEFHRCGAEQWGQGVQNLLNACAGVPILGLSATHIRYLDNQRDMAEELLDGNIASEMSLGEAIVRGILNPPKYVLSVFSYQNDLEKYERRIRRAKNKAVRDAASEYFEALRRAIEKADGLDAVFAKHMTACAGKYLVFCANVEHMDEMIEKVPEWFGRVDSAPHIYRAYADDPGTSQAFADFKADTSEHLKLLFSIDMLNEGVHVEDVDGVILFRPTVSPIVFKQQIGRAMSASKKKNAVIFDIVNNIENLYAIGAIEREMRVAMTYYHDLGEGDEIVNEGFRVFDEVRECRELFEKLDDALSASWELMYSYAAAYYREHGDLEVPRRYQTPEGYSLGSWVSTQRKVYRGDMYGKLDEDRIRKLEEIGMVWESVRDLSWNRSYAEAEKYFAEHGDLRVPIDYVTADGLRLGAWVANQRLYRKEHIRTASLTPERIAALDAIGMIWDVSDYLWTQYYALASEYHRIHGDLMVPNRYVTPDGVRLGQWIANMRSAKKKNAKGYRLAEEQIRQLDEIGMCWNPLDAKWENGFAHACAYYTLNGNLAVPTTYICENGYGLGKWLDHQRESYLAGKLSPERTEKLNSLGMVWEKADPWETRFALAAAYYREHGDLNMPAGYKADGVWLAKWLNEQRQIYIGNRPGKSLSEEQIERLNAIGMVWETRNVPAWEAQFREAKRFYEENGHLQIPQDYKTPSGKKPGVWVMTQRRKKRDGKLSPEQVCALDSIGMVWEAADSWEVGFSHALQYYTEHGDLLIPKGYVCEDGYNLKQWIQNQRTNHNHPTQYHRVTEEQAQRLEEIGMVWTPKADRWQEGYRHAEAYLKTLNGERWKTNYISPDGYKTGSWLRSQARAWERGTMSKERAKALGFPEQQEGTAV